MYNKVNFNHLYYFIVIAKEGSIVKASKILNITQPALSHQLRLLEEDLGKKLFDRVGRKLQINHHGIVVREYANKVFRHAEEMLEVIKTDLNDYIKIIKIGTLPWISKFQTYEFLKPLLSNQHIKAEVYQRGLEELIKDIQNNRIDMILSDSPYTGRSKKLFSKLISKDKVICVSSTKNQKNIHGPFPKNIIKKKIVSYPSNAMIFNEISNYLKANSLDKNTSIMGEFSDSSLIRLTIEKSSAIGFLPSNIAKDSIKNKLLFKVGEPKNITFNLWAITHKNIGKKSLIWKLLYNKS